MKREWNIETPCLNRVAELSSAIGCNPVIASILVNRGFITPEDARAFLNPSLSAIRSPFEIKDIDIAADRIIKAILQKERIQVFGDYDADGVTGTTLLYDFLKYSGADVCFHIPHRISEGYSFKPTHVQAVLRPLNIDLIITVDCGSDSHDAVIEAADAGIDTVITDHHTVKETLPDAVAVVNPKRTDCPSGLSHLAGVGVVFYLLMVLRKKLRDMDFWKDVTEPNLKHACDLVALGTVADVVPLISENRVFTKAGLDIMNNGSRNGIRAIVESAKINKQTLSSEDIAFRIAPRINAAGRIDHAEIAVKLLMADTMTDARKSAVSLNRLNTNRQSVEQTIYDEIVSHIDETPDILAKPAIVLFRQGWHLGVLGIVASKLVSLCQKPVILLTLDGDTGKGSGRSVPGIDLFKALKNCSDSLDAYGGHSLAAGLSIKAKHLRDFTETFETVITELMKETSISPSLSVDRVISFDEITPGLLDELEHLQPFGCGNEEPLFLAENITIASSTEVGRGHKRLVLKSDNGSSDSRFMAMHFNVDPNVDYPNHFNRLVFKLQWNRWNNTRSPQIIIEDFN